MLVRDLALSLKSLFKVNLIRLQNLSYSPSKVVLKNGLCLFVNFNEPRGRAVYMCKAEGQPYIKLFWKKFVELFQPEFVLDIGANYGEFIFCTTYSDHTLNAYAVEANSSLISFLERSKSIHPNRNIISIHNCLASNNNNERVSFFIDRSSSGRSTALENNFVKELVPVSVVSKRIDSMLTHIPKSILFKIDVEGFEPFVLEGLTEYLNRNIPMIGIVELNLSFLEKNGIDIIKYFEFINLNFKIVILRHDGGIEDIPFLDNKFLKKYGSIDLINLDLLLFTSEDLKEKLVGSI